MKLQFKDQQFQTDAVNAIVDIFRGQEKKHGTFTIVQEQQMDLLDNGLGVGNILTLTDEQLIENMQDIQKRNNLPKTLDLEGKSFTIEMEVATGKTMVYSKTILELNRQYGFTKFIIVVPSVAIREGVCKSFEVTQTYLANVYDNVPYRYFIYNSAKLSTVRDFATNSNIEIMIINIDAFKKSENIINQAQDKLNGETAMKYIQDTNPCVLIDESQSVDSTDKAKEAIASLNPLCILRYSATHKTKMNLMYRLTPVDAYQMGLVKQICVSSNSVANDFNKPYIRLVSVSSANGYSAKVEIDKTLKGGKVERKIVSIKTNSELFIISGERELYDGYTVIGIDCNPGLEYIEFTNGEKLKLGQSMGDIDVNVIKRTQIKRTIETHLEKELRYYEKGIKVLSLFFIDEVKKYRDYDNEADTRGIYAHMFEESYNELMALPKFEALKEKFPHAINKVHDGYFSQDKKGNYKNTKGDSIDDHTTYNTIMRDKEWLLSFDCPLRFIFSHSALSEGWDSPNVFQVCTLIEQKSTFTCRQKIGRGLRLCVNQNGERIEDKNINLLHVMANESFAEFADSLQKEIEQETGMKFGVLDIGLFADMTYVENVVEQRNVSSNEAKELITHFENKGYINQNGMPKEDIKKAIEAGVLELPQKFEMARAEITTIISNAEKSEPINTNLLENTPYSVDIKVEKKVSYDEAKELITHFESKGYVTKTGKIKDTMKNALLNGTLDLPKKFESAREKFEKIISKADNKPPIRDASKDVIVRLNNKVVASPEFTALWNKIKQKTMYRVNVDEQELKRICIKELREMPSIPKARIITKTANIDVKKSGVTHEEIDVRTTNLDEEKNKLPDFLRMMDNECFISQKMYIDMMMESGRATDFLDNPQLFIEKFVEIIHNAQYNLEIDGIKYVKLANQEYYVQEIFDTAELIANLDKNAVAVKNSAYDYIIYDSETVEKPFAMALDNDPDVKMFFKIPDKFTIDTPLGRYCPDWGVYMEKDGVEKMYFVLETKGNVSKLELRSSEQLKIHCGEQHFKALENDVELKTASNWGKFKVDN